MTAPAVVETASSFTQLSGAGAVRVRRADGFVGQRPRALADARARSSSAAARAEERAVAIDRRVRETGIAYDIFADPTSRPQRWQLDLVPIIFSSAEWRWTGTALIQRARLFDAVLTDLYGAQHLLRQGVIPPELVFSDRASCGRARASCRRPVALQFYAADLARDADGHWRVIDNHTETLAGIGFALANRVVHTHFAGDLFKQCNVVRLAPFFQNLQVALTAHSGRENARIALLTPGPHHEDYFSHAYLARYLGYLLVEGNDLRTKGSQVYLKTLEGLKGDRPDRALRRRPAGRSAGARSGRLRRTGRAAPASAAQSATWS